MTRFISCREFLEKKQKQKKYRDCLVRIFDFDDYEHMNFRLREDTNFDNFNNVFDQQMLDSCLFSQLITKDETGITIFLHCDIEL